MLLSLLVIIPLLVSVAAQKPRSLVLWHGLGDSYASPGMLEFAELIQDVHPGIFVHSVYIDQDLRRDREAGFYGHVFDQLEVVAAQLAAIPELKNGFDALGFSQGGQFLRAYVEKYNSPPVNNLITFGSQHMGISDLPVCGSWDVFCQIARRATKRAVYEEWAQINLVQAQYFRDPAQLSTYLASSQFLAAINNEVPESKNSTFRDNLSSLNALVLVLFTDDKTVVPKESAWFGSEAITENQQALLPTFDTQQATISLSEGRIVPMHKHPIYEEDWIGLKSLDQQGRIVLDVCQGEHMQISSCWERLVRQWCGGHN